MIKIQQFPFYEETYLRLSTEHEGWHDLTEDQRVELVKNELMGN